MSRSWCSSTGRGAFLRFLPDIQPQVEQKSHVGGEFVFRFALARGAHDEAAGNSGGVDLQNALQAQALIIAGDFAGNAGVFQVGM